VSFRRVVVAASAALLTATLLQPVPAGAAEEDEAAALTVELTRLSRSTIPEKGRIVLAGTVVNDSAETWSAVNVHPVVSSTPMTDRDQLAAAAVSDPAIEIGTRLFKLGQFAPIGDLAPGQATRFRISIAARDLPISREPGVYWIGVHALGQNTEGRDDIADGRARTFIPLVPDGVSTSASVVVPLRNRVRRDPAGKLLDLTGWSQTLADDGRLERIAALLNTTDGASATMLVDPAVIDAVGSVASDNPELSLGEEPASDPDETPDESPGETPSVSSSGRVSRSLARFGPIDRANAARWLAQVKAAAEAQTVLGLAYADPDTASLARRRPGLLALAARESATTFERLGIAALPTVAPASGWLDDAALASIEAETMVLLSDHAAPRTRTQWRTFRQQDLVFADEQAASGGPGPTERLDALAVRQRIVSDAALRALGGARGPLVVSLPADWDPGKSWAAADFFEGLDLPWLNVVPLGPVPPGTPTFDAALGYPQSERRDEVTLANMDAARSLVTTATVMGELLQSTNDVQHALVGIALEAVSQHARRDPVRARSQILATNANMRTRLGKVSVLGTDFVTLSGGSGTLTVTLANELEQTVTVGIQPRSSSGDVQIETPEPLELAPGQRTVLRLRAEASSIGVHEVTLTPVTSEGNVLGTPLTFSLRTSQVGKLIWGLLIGAGSLLVVMIARRVRRGLREHRWRGQ
jgi:hypothetical protein